MTDKSALGDFSNWKGFSNGASEREARRMALEMECAAGALLLLEKAFEDLPALIRDAFLSFRGDHEGGFLSQTMLPSIHGGAVWCIDVVLALRKHQEKLQDLTSEEISMFEEFGALSPETLSDADNAFNMALWSLLADAPRLFHACVSDQGRLGGSRTDEAVCHRGDACAIGRELGLAQSAALIEKSRIDASCCAGAKSSRSLSI